MEENNKPVVSRVWGVLVRELYLKKVGSLFDEHIVRIKEKGERNIGNKKGGI